MRLVYLSPVPWMSFAQRPHKFVEWFHARSGADVLWIDPYPSRLPQLGDLRRIISSVIDPKLSMQDECAPSWLSVFQPFSLPIEPLYGSEKINSLFWNDALKKIDEFVKGGDCMIVLGKPSKLGLMVLDRHGSIPSLYDAMDEFPAFFYGISRRAMANRELEVSSRVSRISVSSTGLANRFVKHHAKVLLALNACALDMLPPPSMPSKLPAVPVLGYVGTIAQWFDWSFVIALALENPEMRIRLVGPIVTLPPKSRPNNIELLPACDHRTAIKYMQEFSVGLIPFKLDKLTASVDPIKYYEYRALGLPVVSTNFGEMAYRQNEPGVFISRNGSDLHDLIKEALAFESDPVAQLNFRAENSWNFRFDSSGILTNIH